MGALAAALATGIPGTRVELIDIEPEKARIAAALGVDFALPGGARGDADIVVHASASGDGLALALTLPGFEATVFELSWYDSTPVHMPLGEGFHSRRLTLRASQVGAVPTSRRAQRTAPQRLALALELLADARLDALLEPPIPFARLPQTMAEVLARPGVMCQLVTYR